MKKRIAVLVVFFMIVASAFAQNEKRITNELQTQWKFSLGTHNDAYMSIFDDSNWSQVTLPHDWAIKGPFIEDGNGGTGKLPWKGEGWYRTTLKADKNLQGKILYLLCDGIMAFPEVYVNGELAGSWDYGYNSFYLNISDHFNYNKENTIAIHVDTRKIGSRWYPGAGIYRKIQLVAVDPIHVKIWGTQITTPQVKTSYADISIATSINNYSNINAKVELVHKVFTADNKLIKTVKLAKDVGLGKSKRLEATFSLANPQLWNLDNPNLYKVQTFVYVNNEIRDNYESTFGIRKMRFTANNGFYLNDKRIQIKGVNLHHDHGPLGAAFYPRAMERQLEIMKSMGCNAVRTSHNGPAPELLDLCDQMGLLVYYEFFDKYDDKAAIVDTTNFDSFAKRNIGNFVERDRNHPSIFIWSVGNEIDHVQLNENNGFHQLNTMVSYTRMYDPTRPVTMGCHYYGTAKLGHSDYYDVHSWNYGRKYLDARKYEPNKSVIISESASTLSTRGFYEWPLPNNKTQFTSSLQVSSYDLNAPVWAEIADDDFMWQQQDEFVAGEFVWTGFDYLGEPTPYDNNFVKEGLGLSDTAASRSSYFGIVDLCGIPKDRYYLYKSYWKPEETTVHILPHWNWKEKVGDTIPVFVYTNGDSAELYLNGVSLGKKSKQVKSNNSVDRFRLMWTEVVYEPGELKAVAFMNGEVIGESIVKTTGEPYKLKASPDRTKILSGGKDLSYVLIEALDKDGNLCPMANDKVELKISGVGQIEGVGNGNPQSMKSFKSESVNLFYGKAMVIVRSGFTKGVIDLQVETEQMKKASIKIEVQ